MAKTLPIGSVDELFLENLAGAFLEATGENLYEKLPAPKALKYALDNGELRIRSDNYEMVVKRVLNSNPVSITAECVLRGKVQRSVPKEARVAQEKFAKLFEADVQAANTRAASSVVMA